MNSNQVTSEHKYSVTSAPDMFGKMWAEGVHSDVNNILDEI
jgi:hypothetical protein